MGADIPRVAVCPDHQPPFKLLADLYFERIPSALALANRGGSKTFIVAVLHFLNSTYKPGCESLSFGATEGQGQRCYSHIESWCYESDRLTGRRTDIVKPFIRDKPKKSETVWKTDSKIEVVAGSENAVSGPHPAKAHADEIELMDDPVWVQSRGMAVTNRATGPLPPFMAKFNGSIPPQDIATSTRNSTKGRMQDLLDEIAEDLKNGDIPQFTLITWCIWETVAEQPNCRNAPDEARRARLIELDLDPCSLCECHRVSKGNNPDGSRRTLQDACGRPDRVEPGHEYKGFRARGWKPSIDLIQTFKRNTPGTWLLQHECRAGRDENSYIEDWSLSDFGIREYEPHPMYGPIYQGVDWGTTHPAAVLWFQYLTAEVPGLDFEYQPIWLQPGIYVLFKEIYVAGIDTEALARRVVMIERRYQGTYGRGWQVRGRFCDPAGAGDRIIFNNHGLASHWPIKTRNKERMITTVQNIVVDDRFAVDVEAAPMFCEEVEIWQKNPRTGKELDRHNHAMAAWRYGISNAEVLEGKIRVKQGDDRKSKTKRAVAPRKRLHGDMETGQINFGGGIAARGGTSVPIPPEFLSKR